SVPSPSAYFGTSCMSMYGDFPGASKCCCGTMGSYQYKTFLSLGAAAVAAVCCGMAWRVTSQVPSAPAANAAAAIAIRFRLRMSALLGKGEVQAGPGLAQRVHELGVGPALLDRVVERGERRPQVTATASVGGERRLGAVVGQRQQLALVARGA